MTTRRKRQLKPINVTINWRIYIFVLDELEKDIKNRGFKSVPNQVNVILRCYFNGEIQQRPKVDQEDIDMSSMSTTPVSWKIRRSSYNLLKQDAKNYKSASALANNILMRYVLGQSVQRGQ